MRDRELPASIGQALLLAAYVGFLVCSLAQWCLCRHGDLASVLHMHPGRGANRRRARRPTFGVNYGNRFIPEDWMRHPYDFFAGVRKHELVDRVALWDLAPGQEPPPRERMLAWLEATIAEEHFAEMQRLGVELVRVPCGYWNWASYAGDDGPAALEGLEGVPVAERLRNLHRIARPEEYRPYFDRIFAFAARHGIKVLLDLHGLPGSQNGEIHSGACTETKGERGAPFFEAEANKRMAIRAVRSMAEYAQQKGSSLFGIQVISEPHLQSDDKGHSFLRDYYQRAIMAAREFLHESIPVVLFEWTYGMENWGSDDFPESAFGRVMWDTHLYHFPERGERWTTDSGGLEQLSKAYEWDLQQLRSFSRRHDGRVLVGEFALVGQSLDKAGVVELARWFLDQFGFASAGCLLWSFDGVHPAWSMCRQRAAWGLDWRRLARAARVDAARRGPPILLQAAAGGQWLSVREGGAVCVTAAEPSSKEEWVPYRCGTGGQRKVALRSVALGTWLSVDESGKVLQASARDAWEEFIPAASGAGSDAAVRLVSFHGSWVCALSEYSAVVAVPCGSDASSLDGLETTWIPSPT